jgi:hypothetical protein
MVPAHGGFPIGQLNQRLQRLPAAEVEREIPDCPALRGELRSGSVRARSPAFEAYSPIVLRQFSASRVFGDFVVRVTVAFLQPMTGKVARKRALMGRIHQQKEWLVKRKA